MNKLIDLEKHVSIRSSHQINQIIQPLRDAFDMTYFRYLKFYKDGKKTILSNKPDAMRYLYEQGRYQHMWFDGNFPDFMRPGWYNWESNRALDTREIENEIESELNRYLDIYHGLTLVLDTKHCYEIFSFDSKNPFIYSADKHLLARFIPYFREQAKKIIYQADHEKIVLPISQDATFISFVKEEEKLSSYLSSIQVDRYYLGEKYQNTYLTVKEIACIQGLLQGKTANEIALTGKCQPKTIHRHIENIKTKLQCHKQAEIVKIAIEAGIF